MFSLPPAEVVSHVNVEVGCDHLSGTARARVSDHVGSILTNIAGHVTLDGNASGHDVLGSVSAD